MRRRTQINPSFVLSCAWNRFLESFCWWIWKLVIWLEHRLVGETHIYTFVSTLLECGGRGEDSDSDSCMVLLSETLQHFVWSRAFVFRFLLFLSHCRALEYFLFSICLIFDFLMSFCIHISHLLLCLLNQFWDASPLSTSLCICFFCLLVSAVLFFNQFYSDHNTTLSVLTNLLRSWSTKLQIEKGTPTCLSARSNITWKI